MPLETTVLESLSCPSCFTHYGLRPERVHAGIRRARCFRCGNVFGVEEAVQHLLAPSPTPALAEASGTATLEAIHPEDLLELDSVLSSPSPMEASPEDSALTLGDLEGSEDEILEKTLVIEPTPQAEVADEGPAAFSSAKDAISRLLGDEPSPTVERRTSRNNSMDVEATLDALEHTLGGTPTRSPEAVAPPPGQAAALGSTVRLSPSELHAAMAAGAPSSRAPTVALPPRPAFTPQPQAPISLEATPLGDSNIFKIQVGQETFQNVTLDQVTAWIEQGRVQDWHMVARQFSDNWIEAAKVPSLRPIFERVRRTNPSVALPPEAPALFEVAPVKKGLFGWMTHRH